MTDYCAQGACGNCWSDDCDCPCHPVDPLTPGRGFLIGVVAALAIFGVLSGVAVVILRLARIV